MGSWVKMWLKICISSLLLVNLHQGSSQPIQDQNEKEAGDTKDSAWGGMVAYSDSNGTPEDEWGGCLDTGHCHKYHEQNTTAQDFHNITIYEPCNYVSNVAYYHVVTQICKHKGHWNMPNDHVRALLQGFATLAMGSSFWHGSHTYLGNVADNRFIDVISFVAHQASVRNLPGISSVVKDSV